MSIDELAEILGEELELPDIQPKGENRISEKHERYTGIRRVGPESLKHFKRTFREALKRQIISGTFDQKNPVVIPNPNDKRFRSWKTTSEPIRSTTALIMPEMEGRSSDRLRRRSPPAQRPSAAGPRYP